MDENANTKEEEPKRFPLDLTPADKEKLREIAKVDNRRMQAEIRHLIHNRHRALFPHKHVPTPANIDHAVTYPSIQE